MLGRRIPSPSRSGSNLNSAHPLMYDSDNIIFIVFWYCKWKGLQPGNSRTISNSSTGSGREYFCISFLNVVVKDDHWIVLIDRYLVSQLSESFPFFFYHFHHSTPSASTSNAEGAPKNASLLDKSSYRDSGSIIRRHTQSVQWSLILHLSKLHNIIRGCGNEDEWQFVTAIYRSISAQHLV